MASSSAVSAPGKSKSSYWGSFPPTPLPWWSGKTHGPAQKQDTPHHPCAGVACVEQAGQSLLWVELAARVVDSKCRERVLYIAGGGGVDAWGR